MRTRTDVVLAALGLRVEKVRGTRAWIRCPFHEADAATSFFVRRSGERAGLFHCYSCKAKGNLSALVEHVRGVDREDARKFVQSAGRDAEPGRRRARVVAREPELARARFQLPAEVAFDPWDAWPTEFREYLEERGLGREETEAFRIGFATDGVLSGRVVIPFLDERGRAGTYSARTVVGDEPKYKTPFENDRPDLEAVFGAHLWPPMADRRQCVVIPTEGAIDAMSVRRAASGLPNVYVAAINGSHPEPGQLLALASFGHVVDGMDGDEAGDRAARAIRYGVARHARYTRFRLPEDASSLWAAGGARRRSLREAIMVAIRG